MRSQQTRWYCMFLFNSARFSVQIRTAQFNHTSRDKNRQTYTKYLLEHYKKKNETNMLIKSKWHMRAEYSVDGNIRRI